MQGLTLAQLRKKNRLMRAGRTEEAGALAKRIRDKTVLNYTTRGHQTLRQRCVGESTTADWSEED